MAREENIRYQRPQKRNNIEIFMPLYIQAVVEMSTELLGGVKAAPSFEAIIQGVLGAHISLTHNHRSGILAADKPSSYLYPLKNALGSASI